MTASLATPRLSPGSASCGTGPARSLHRCARNGQAAMPAPEYHFRPNYADAQLADHRGVPHGRAQSQSNDNSVRRPNDQTANL